MRSIWALRLEAKEGRDRRSAMRRFVEGKAEA